MRISSETDEHFFSLCHSMTSLYTCSYRCRDFAGNNLLPMILSASAFNSCMIEFSIPDLNETIIKNIIPLFHKPQNVKGGRGGGGGGVYHNINDRSNVVTPHMEINIREVASLSVNVSPIGELCAAECRSENGQIILIVVIYIRVNQTITDIIDFTNTTITSVYAAWFGGYMKKL